VEEVRNEGITDYRNGADSIDHRSPTYSGSSLCVPGPVSRVLCVPGSIRPYKLIKVNVSAHFVNVFRIRGGEGVKPNPNIVRIVMHIGILGRSLIRVE
jgi:hypothetical protein